MDGVSYFLTGFLRQGNAALARAYLGIGGGGGIPEAPINGTYYSRFNAGWANLPIASAVNTGVLSAADFSLFSAKQPAGAYLTDAPSDGNTYGRKNGVWSVTPKEFTSPEIPADNSTTTGSFAHGLGKTPQIVRMVMRCKAADVNLGFSVGDEVDAAAFFDINILAPLWSWGANSTNVFAGSQDFLNGNETIVGSQAKGGQNYNNVSIISNWVGVIYAVAF